MKLSIADYNDTWTVVTICCHPDWRRSTFFPLIDGMYGQVKLHYEKDPHKLAFDVSALDYIDSSMISLFIQSARLMKKEKPAIIVAHKEIMDMITLLGIDKIYDVYESYELWREAVEEEC
jgi:ABC-type transporter Mla MlaB component